MTRKNYEGWVIEKEKRCALVVSIFSKFTGEISTSFFYKAEKNIWYLRSNKLRVQLSLGNLNRWP